MKKTMLLFVSLLLSVSVNAASLNLTPVGLTEVGVFLGNNSESVTASGLLVQTADAPTPYQARFDLVSDMTTGVNLASQLIPLISGSLDIFRVDQNSTLVQSYSIVTNAAGTSSVGFFIALANETYRIVLRSSHEKAYNLNASVSEVPLPAAFFLFAPALLGLLGLRRKASIAA